MQEIKYTVELERDPDGRWIAEVPALPGCMVYGNSREDALQRVKALAQAVIEDLQVNREGEDLSPVMVAKMAKRAGLGPEDFK